MLSWVPSGQPTCPCERHHEGGLSAFMVPLSLTAESSPPTEAPSLPPSCILQPPGLVSPPPLKQMPGAFETCPLVFGILTRRLGVPAATLRVQILERPLQNCPGWGPNDKLCFCEVCKVPKTSPVLWQEQPMEATARTPPTPPQWHPCLSLSLPPGLPDTEVRTRQPQGL